MKKSILAEAHLHALTRSKRICKRKKKNQISNIFVRPNKKKIHEYVSVCILCL